MTQDTPDDASRDYATDSLHRIDVDAAGITVEHPEGQLTLTPTEAARLGSTLSVAAHLDFAEWRDEK